MAVIVTITPDSNHATVDNLEGFSIMEDTDAAVAKIEIRKAAVGGEVLMYINLAAGETVNFEFARPAPMEGGTYIKEVSGSVTGSLWGE